MSENEAGDGGGTPERTLLRIARTKLLCRSKFSLPIVDGTNLSNSALDSLSWKKLDSKLEYWLSLVGPTIFTMCALRSRRSTRDPRCTCAMIPPAAATIPAAATKQSPSPAKVQAQVLHHRHSHSGTPPSPFSEALLHSLQPWIPGAHIDGGGPRSQPMGTRGLGTRLKASSRERVSEVT